MLVPARNERAVIAAILGDVAQQTLPPGVEMRLVVIDDGSVDGTGDVARGALDQGGIAERSTIVRRDDVAHGKGAALAAGLEAARSRWRLSPDATVLVLDADARIEPTFVADFLGAARGRAAAARRRMLQPSGDDAPSGTDAASRWRGWLARVQDDEQTVDLAIRTMRSALGGTGELRGNAMLLPLRDLDAIGGFPTDALCEDLELSSALLDVGRPVKVLAWPSVWEQPVLGLPELIGQRLRWAEGAIRRDLRWVVPRLADHRLPLRTRLDATAYASQTLLGIVIAGSWFGAALGRRRSRLAPTFAAAAGVVAFVGAAAGLRQFGTPRRADGRRATQAGNLLGRAAGVVLFGALWLPVTAVAWVRVTLACATGRGPTPSEPTPKREGVRAPWDPPSDVGGRDQSGGSMA